MKNLIFIIPLLTLIGCGTYEPLIDLKASKEGKAKHAQEDHMECEWLIERYAEGLFTDENEMIRKCLDGRGHSVLN